MRAEIKHCRDCNKDYVFCKDCGLRFATNLPSHPEVVGHNCGERQRQDTADTAKAAAAGAAGGAAAGAAGGMAVTAAAPAALGAAGFTSSGVAGGSLAASLQGLLYAGATPAGGWFATCTSAAMGGAMGTAAVATAAATGGVALAAGAGYGIYKLLKRKEGQGKGGDCPWCENAEKGVPPGGPGKGGKTTQGGKQKKSVCFGDHLVSSDQDMMELAIKQSLLSFQEEADRRQGVGLQRQGGQNKEDQSRDNQASDDQTRKDQNREASKEFICPVCLEVMGPPLMIWQCSNSHLLCNICKEDPRVTSCPSCRGKMIGRNLAMENVAKIIGL